MPIFADNRTLLDAFRRGEKRALETVYWHYVDQVAAVIQYGVSLSAQRRVAGADYFVAADLVQDTFVRAFADKARMGFDGVREYRSYLLGIARNVLVDWARKQRRELLVDEIPDVAAVEEPPANWEQPEVMACVATFVTTLKAPLRDVYQKRYVEGISQQQTAQDLGITRQRIRTLETKLRRALRRALRQRGLL